MFTVNRNHFGFSDWTLGPASSIGKALLVTCLFTLSLGSYGQIRGTRPNVQSSVPSLSPSSTFSSSSPHPPPLPPPPPPPQSSLSSVQQTKCPYSSEQILGIIFTSVVVTIVIIGLTLILFWFLWKKKIITPSGIGIHWIRGFDLNHKNIQVDATKQQHHHEQQQQPPPQQLHPNGNVINDEDKKYKRLIKSLPPLTSIFNHLQSKGSIKSLDDTFIMSKPEQVSVQMTGHDFTGLGFNICGNMRDGIFIKDLLTRGPANESGLIKAGDRIMSITVSCDKMVYEDALTILSYASPYEVTLQVEKTSKLKATAPNGGSGSGHIYVPRRYANGYSGSSDPSHRILHPIFRSHSVGELTNRWNSCGDTSGSADASKPSSFNEKTFGSISKLLYSK